MSRLTVWPQTKLDDCTRIRDQLRLPTMIGLILLHRSLGIRVPMTGRLSLQIASTSQRRLNLHRPIVINRPLSGRSCHRSAGTL